MSTPKHDIAHALIEHRGETIRLLKAERDQAREDARVLRTEALAWRRQWEEFATDTEHDATLCPPHAECDATNASGALERNKP